MKSMESTLKRTWAVIDLDALKENYEKNSGIPDDNQDNGQLLTK